MRRFALPACAVCALYLSWIVVPRVLAQTSPRPAGWTEATHGTAFEQAIDGPGGLLEIAERRRELIRAALKK